MDYVLGERGDKCDQLQCEMHMAAAVDGHRKKSGGVFSLYEWAQRVLLSFCVYALPSCT